MIRRGTQSYSESWPPAGMPPRIQYVIAACANDLNNYYQAMDHILENNDNPVPDPASQGPAAGAGAGNTGPSGMDLDDEDDEDAAAIRAALGKSSANIAPGGSAAEAGGSGDGEGAKVSHKNVLAYCCASSDYCI